MSEIVTTLSAVVLGIAGVAAFFVVANRAVDLLPAVASQRVRPWVFAGPALVVLFLILVLPTLRTIMLSFFGPAGREFVGLENYTWAFTSPQIRTVFRNNVLWLVLVPLLATGIGLMLAVLADRMKHEKLVKSLIFMPMAISFVGASVIWQLIYAYKPAGSGQIGLLNAVWTAFGGEPRAWLTIVPLNTFLLIVIMVWIQTGFAMVVLSAAVRGIPEELIEAARIDGASEWRIFWRITVPSIASTIAVVATTIVILVLKIYDIVKVTTNGEYQTNVIANELYDQAFRFLDYGHGAALAVILFVVVVPIMVYNVRRFRGEERTR